MATDSTIGDGATVVQVAPVPAASASVVTETSPAVPAGESKLKTLPPFAYGVVRFLLVVMRIFVNPRYIWNSSQCKRLERTGRAFFIGSGKIMYAWPVSSAAILCQILIWCGLPSTAVGFVYVAIVLLAFVVIGFDVTRATVGWVLFGILLPVFVCVVMQLGFHVQVASGLGRFLRSFNPSYPVGFANLLGFGLLVFQILDVITATRHNALKIVENNYIPRVRLGFEGDLSHATHAVFYEAGLDFMEAAPPFHSVTIYLRNRTDTQRSTVAGTDSLHDASCVITNVAAGVKVKHAIDEAMGELDVRSTPQPTVR